MDFSSPGPGKSSFQIVHLPPDRGWTFRVDIDSQRISLELAGRSDQIDFAYWKSPGSSCHEEDWLERNELEKLSEIARNIAHPLKRESKLSIQDAAGFLVTWLAQRSAGRTRSSCSSWIEKEARRRIDWHWVWLHVPIHPLECSGIEALAFPVSRDVSVRVLDGLAARRLFFRSLAGCQQQRGARASEEAWRALGLPVPFWNEPTELEILENLVERKRSFDWTPTTKEEELEHSLREPCGVFVAVLHLGTLGSSYDYARRVHQSLTPFVALESESASTLDPGPMSSGATEYGRVGFVIRGRSREIVPINGFPLRFENEARFGPDPGEPGDLTKLPFTTLDHFLEPLDGTVASGLRTAVGTFGRALADSSLESRVVTLDTVVEVVFSSGSDGKKDGRANLMKRIRGYSTRFPSERGDLSGKIEHLHKLRNRIVHDGGLVGQCDHGTVRDAQHGLRDLLLTLLRHLRSSSSSRKEIDPKMHMEELKKQFLEHGTSSWGCQKPDE